MSDRRTPEPVDGLDAFASETDGIPPLAPAPLRGPWDSSMSIGDERGAAIVNSVQALADRVDVLSITAIATTQRLTGWIIGLAVITGLLVLAVLAQTYLWLTVAGGAR